MSVLKNIVIFAMFIHVVYANYFHQNIPFSWCYLPSGYVDEPPRVRDFYFMKKIIVNSPKFGEKEILVDDSDYDSLIKHHWHISKYPNTFYARGKVGGITIYMHRLIMDVLDKKDRIDHKDHNGLNNQRSNLRAETFLNNNNQNRTASKNKSSKYLGVYKYYPKYVYRNTKGDVIRRDYNTQKWGSILKAKNRVKKFLGYFDNEIDAAKAYDKAAKETYGEWANLNFKD